MTATKSKSVSSGAYSATLHVLGGFELRDGDGQPIELKARKSRQLLAYLAIPSGQPRSREQLAALLWGDRQEEQARGSLRTALSGIRRAVGDEALIVENDMVRLRSGHLETDYSHLKRLSSDDNGISALAEFYPGEFLAGLEHDSELYMDWLRGLRVESIDLAMTVLENNAERYSTAGEYKSAINLMRESLSLEPLKEQTHRTIMQLYAATGEKAMALAQYRTCKEVLLHELDAAPDPETQALADSIALRDTSVLQTVRQQTVSQQDALALPAFILPIQDGNVTSIAVLPFVNMSGDAEQNYFADGITEDIIVDLCCVKELSVAAKSSSEIYRGTATSAARISDELGVRYILEGSLRKSGDHVRISALLIDAKTSRQIWAKRYDRKLENIFELQSEISDNIVESLKLNLPKTSGSSPGRRGTESVEAYELYLRARMLMDEYTAPATSLAKDLFKQSIKVDPSFALALTGYADSLIREVVAYNADPSLADEAAKVCEKAETLSPNLAELYRAKGGIAAFFGNDEEAEKLFLKAIQIEPNSALTYTRLGYFYTSTERGKDLTWQAYKRSFELEPENIANNTMILMYLRDRSRSEQKLFGNQLLSIAKKRVFLNPYHFDATKLIAETAFLLGNKDEAYQWLRIASAFALSDARTIYNLACTHAVMGNVDEAFELLSQALDVGISDAMIAFMKSADPDLDSVRADPRFAKLLERS